MTTGDAQIERLQNIRFGFEQHIATGDAAIRRTVFDVGRHVSGFDKDEAHHAALVFDRQTPRFESARLDRDARTCEQVQRARLHSAFSERDGQGRSVRLRLGINNV